MLRGRVYLLGVGPGDPELITQRASRRLAEADVIFYDALAHPELLELCRRDAEKVFVGRRDERASTTVERMIASAREGNIVARLEGEDSHRWGCGSEEAEALHAAGVPFEIVPGVSAPNAVSVYAGIPLTHRSSASSVAYVIATESTEKSCSSHDWAKLATATETLVISAEMHRLESIMRLLVAHGRRSDTPAALVESVSLPRQRTIVATVETIAERAHEAGVGTPTLTVIGDVVQLRDALRWYDRKPLFGRRVLVTRPEDRSEAMVRRLRDEGAEAIALAAIRIAPPLDPAPLERAARDAGTYDWVIFTSASGVDAFFAELERQERDGRAFGTAKICAIGPATAEALRRHGLRADAIPTEFRGEGAARVIIDAHEGDPSGLRILLPRAEVAREVLPDTLRNAGAHVDVVHAYRNLPASKETEEAIRHAITEREVDVVTFTAPSTVASMVRILGEDAPRMLAQLTTASIGPITTAAAVKHAIRIDVTAQSYTGDGLVDALREHCVAPLGRLVSSIAHEEEG